MQRTVSAHKRRLESVDLTGHVEQGVDNLGARFDAMETRLQTLETLLTIKLVNIESMLSRIPTAPASQGAQP